MNWAAAIWAARGPAALIVAALALFGTGYLHGRQAGQASDLRRAGAMQAATTEAMGAASERALTRAAASAARQREVADYARSLDQDDACVRPAD